MKKGKNQPKVKAKCDLVNKLQMNNQGHLSWNNFPIKKPRSTYASRLNQDLLVQFFEN